MKQFSIELQKHRSEDIARKNINYRQTPEFEKDFKALLKRYRTLESDFKTFKQYSLETFYEKHIQTTSFVPIEGACSQNCIANKVKKFACKSLPKKGNHSGIRIIFVYDSRTNTIYFVEIYFKGDKENENRDRIKKIIRSLEIKN